MSIQIIIDNKGESDNIFLIEQKYITLTPKQHKEIMYHLEKIDKIIYPYSGRTYETFRKNLEESLRRDLAHITII